MPDIEKTLKRLTTRQEKALTSFAQDGVDFIIIGGYAEVYHKVKSRTCDLDLLVKASRDNAERIVAVLQKVDKPAWSPEELREKFRKPNSVGRCPNIEVDLLTSEKKEFQNLRDRALVEDWNGMAIPIVSKPDLADLKYKKNKAMK